MEQYGLRNFKICAMYLFTEPAHTSQPLKHSLHVIPNKCTTYLLADLGKISSVLLKHIVVGIFP